MPPKRSAPQQQQPKSNRPSSHTYNLKQVMDRGLSGQFLVSPHFKGRPENAVCTPRTSGAERHANMQPTQHPGHPTRFTSNTPFHGVTLDKYVTKHEQANAKHGK